VLTRIEEDRQMSPDDFDSEVNRLLALKLESRTLKTAEVSMPVRQAYDRGAGVIQGGIISSLADATAVAVLMPNKPFGRAMTSIEFKLNFLRPALVGAGPLLGRAVIVRSGHTVAVCEVDVTQGDEMVAKGLFTYLYFDPRQ
jgi:uncharacterized protein (TIGR00369 family)